MWAAIWYFIIENWVVVLIVLVVLGVGNAIYEKLSEVWGDKRQASRDMTVQIRKYGSLENYERFVQLRERVRSANSRNEILVYGLGGRDNIKSIEAVEKKPFGGKLVVEVRDALAVRRDAIDFLCTISAFEFGILELSGINDIADFRSEFVAFLETDAAAVQGLRGL